MSSEATEDFYTLLCVRPDGVASVVDLVATRDLSIVRHRAEALLNEHLSADTVGRRVRFGDGYPTFGDAAAAV